MAVDQFYELTNIKLVDTFQNLDYTVGTRTQTTVLKEVNGYRRRKEKYPPRPKKPWENPTAQETASRNEYTYVIENLKYRANWGTKPWCNQHTVSRFSFTSDPPPDWQWANILAGKVKNLRVNLASDLAEAREAMDLAAGIAEELTRAIRIARGIMMSGGGLPGKFKLIYRELRRNQKLRDEFQVPATWLGLNLAILPMMGTLANVLDKLNDPNNKRPMLRVIKFGHREQMAGNVVFYSPTDHTGVGKGHCRETYQYRVTAYVELLPQKGVFDQNFAVGNPLEWAWELIPLSFVLDWFIPIGSYLSALDAYQGITSVRGTFSTTRSRTATGVFKPGFSTESQGCYFGKSHSRSAFLTPPPLSIPRWTPSPSWTKMTTALSLLAQALHARG